MIGVFPGSSLSLDTAIEIVALVHWLTWEKVSQVVISIQLVQDHPLAQLLQPSSREMDLTI